MVGATRGTLKGFQPDQASGSQQPPPAPPNLAEVMARQTKLLNQLGRLKWANSITNPEAEMNLHQPVIKTSSVPSLHCSIRWISPLTLTLGSVPSSPSSPYCLPHVQMRTRHSLQPSNSVALPASGRIIIMPCSLPVILSLGTSFGPLFERTTSAKDSLSESSMNFQN
jgi:hypothetical protein